MNGIQRVLATMVENAIDGFVTISHLQISELSSVVLPHIGYHLKRLRRAEVVTIAQPSRHRTPATYHILRPEFTLTTRDAWTTDRIALLSARHTEKDKAAVLAALNALPGSVLTTTAMRKKASKLWGQKRDARGVAPAKVVVHSLPPKVASPKPIWGPSQSSFTPAYLIIGTLPPYREGECRWPLRCGAPAEKLFCDHHTRLRPSRSGVADRVAMLEAAD